MLTDFDIIKIAEQSRAVEDQDFLPVQFARAIIEAHEAKLREQKHVYWTHSCNVLCLDNVELWIDSCPHCGKPSPFGVTK